MFVLRMEAGMAAEWKNSAYWQGISVPVAAGRQSCDEEILVGYLSGEEHEAMGKL